MDTQKKILLVEDDIVIATLEKRQLEKRGYSIVHVSSGEKAIEHLQKEPASLVLMDIDLGMGMDGTQTAEKILSFTEIPIVFLSSHTEPEVVEKTEKITSYGYVVKNSGITVLDASIKMAFKLFDARQSIISHKNDLLESKRILTESQEMAKVGSWSLDVFSQIITLSPEHQYMVEGKRYEISMPLKEFSHRYIVKEDHEKIAARLESAIREIHNLDYSDEFEYRLVDPAKKEIRYMLVRGRNQRNGIIYGITHDITDRKNIEQELIQRKEFLRVTLNSIGDAVISTDTAGFVTGMNPMAETLTGYMEKDALGKPIGQVFRIFSSVTGEPVKDPIRKVLETGAVAGLANHTQLVSREGHVYQIADSVAPIREPEGNIMGVVMIFRDITEEYAIQEKIARDEERYRKIYNNAPMGIFDYDHNGIIRECNDTFVALIGSSRDALLGLNILRDLKDEKIKDAVRATLSGKNASFQDWYSSVTANKNTFVHVLFHPVYDSLGEIVGGVAMVDDITPMKNLEMELARSLEENKELLRELQHRAKNS